MRIILVAETLTPVLSFPWTVLATKGTGEQPWINIIREWPTSDWICYSRCIYVPISRTKHSSDQYHSLDSQNGTMVLGLLKEPLSESTLPSLERQSRTISPFTDISTPKVSQWSNCIHGSFRYMYLSQILITWLHSNYKGGLRYMVDKVARLATNYIHSLTTKWLQVISALGIYTHQCQQGNTLHS